MIEPNPPGAFEIVNDPRQEIARRTRRSLLAGAATLAAAGVAARLMTRGPKAGLLLRPFRAAEEFNAAVSRRLFAQKASDPTYPASRAVPRPFANGHLGIRKDLDPATWRLQLTGLRQPSNHPRFTPDVASWQYRYHPSFTEQARLLDSQFDPGPIAASDTMTEENVTIANASPGNQPPPPPPPPSVPGLLLTLDDLKSLPFVQQTTEFKCIEGWSQIVTHGGVRFRDFLEAYPPLRNPDGSLPRFAAISTPDASFYCGYDIESLLHPQTLLCYQISGLPITPAHGAPLRLSMPRKYGYKQIKQIASIAYTNIKPQDYWGSHAYDWDGSL